MTEDMSKYGSFRTTSRSGNKIDLAGLSADVSKLPQTDYIATGSTAYCIDTGDLYMYESTGKTWYKQ